MSTIISKVVSSVFVSGIFVAFLVLVFSVFSTPVTNNTANTVSVQPPVATAQSITSSIPTIANTTNNTATTESAESNIPVVPKELSITSVAVGQPIIIPIVSQKLGYLQLLRTTATPTISSQQALQIIYNHTGNSWALGKTFRGQPLTVTAAFGLVTSGSKDSSSGEWIGDRSIPIRRCPITPGGICGDITQTLDHVENRLSWVIDYANVDFDVPRPACLSQTCPTPSNVKNTRTNHVVYVVDIQLQALTGIEMFAS
jgi:hypothetical protein